LALEKCLLPITNKNHDAQIRGMGEATAGPGDVHPAKGLEFNQTINQ
jgi:hypothetical protein